MLRITAATYLLIAALLSSCSTPAPAPAPTLTPTPSFTPSSTPSPTPSLTPTPTTRPTLTPLPSIPGQPVTITLLTTSDLHVEFSEKVPMWFPAIARISAFVKDVRQQRGAENVLLLDGGDTITPLTLQEEDFVGDQVLRAIGYDAIALGNHEWDWGRKGMLERVDRIGPLYLAANLSKKDASGGCSWEPFFDGYRIFEKGPRENPVRIAVIGITGKTLNDNEICSRHKPAEMIAHLVQTTEVGQADAIIIVTHSIMQAPLYGGQVLVDTLEPQGIHLAMVLGGHGHKNQNEMRGTTLLIEPGAESKSIGIVTLTIDKDNRTTTVSLEGVEPLTEASPVDPEIVDLMERLLRPLFALTPSAAP